MKTNTILALGLIVALTSCSEKKEAAQSDPTQTNTTDQGALTGLVLDSAPAEAIDIAVLRTTAQAGDSVTFKGDVLGSHSVFMEGRAVMVMGDPKKITACNLNPDDECTTPWDVCCDDPDVITASIVTVQAVDGSGKPIKSGLKGLNGLEELSTVTITGEVASSSSETNMLVNASGIYIHPKK